MDFINSSSISQITLANEQITNKSGEPFGLDFPDKLEAILSEMDSFDSILDNKERIIKKTSTLITGIVFDQPFKNGNKRTALAIGILLIRNSGLAFPMAINYNKKRYSIYWKKPCSDLKIKNK